MTENGIIERFTVPGLLERLFARSKSGLGLEGKSAIAHLEQP